MQQQNHCSTFVQKQLVRWSQSIHTLHCISPQMLSSGFREGASRTHATRRTRVSKNQVWLYSTSCCCCRRQRWSRWSNGEEKIQNWLKYGNTMGRYHLESLLSTLQIDKRRWWNISGQPLEMRKKFNHTLLQTEDQLVSNLKYFVLNFFIRRMKIMTKIRLVLLRRRFPNWLKILRLELRFT